MIKVTIALALSLPELTSDSAEFLIRKGTREGGDLGGDNQQPFYENLQFKEKYKS